MSSRLSWAALAIFAAVAFVHSPRASERLSREEALALAFPGCRVERRVHYLTAEQLRRAGELAGAVVESGLWTAHAATRDGTSCGTAYFDHHVVRTLPETLMVAVTPQGTLRRVEVLVFDEPSEYLPKPAWYAQFVDQKLGPELALKQHIRPVTGASLTARATTDAVRRVLAVHRVLMESAKP